MSYDANVSHKVRPHSPYGNAEHARYGRSRQVFPCCVYGDYEVITLKTLHLVAVPQHPNHVFNAHGKYGGVIFRVFGRTVEDPEGRLGVLVSDLFQKL